MDYSYVNDTKLREELLKIREKKKSSKKKAPSSQDETIKIPTKKSAPKKSPPKKDKPVAVEKKQNLPPNKKFESFKAKKAIKRKVKIKAPNTKTLAISTKQLSSMVRTGLPLLEALNIMSESSEDPSLKFVFKDASIGISRGATFTSILEKYPEVFNDMYVALVSAGETAGLLPDVLEREAMLLESLAKIKGQISAAMAYPIAIFVLTLAVIVIMLVFVIPIFTDMYANSGSALPALTQILVDASNAIKDPIFLLKFFPSLFFIVWIAKKGMKTNKFINWRDIVLLKLPVTKDLVTKSCLANFSRTLSALNTAGVPILESLTISKRTLGNRVFQRIADRMNSEIQAGQPIYKVLAEEDEIIPIMFTSMFRIGEETGELSEMVNKLADFYEDEVSTSVKGLTSVLEPLMIVFVAGVVAFILVAMYLPMFNMMSTVS